MVEDETDGRVLLDRVTFTLRYFVRGAKNALTQSIALVSSSAVRTVRIIGTGTV